MMQPFRVERTQTASDGRNGRVGTPVEIYKSLGKFTPIAAKRDLEAAQTTLRSAYTLEMRNNKAYEPRVNDEFIFRVGRFALQTKEFTDDTMMWYRLTLLEQGDV